MFMKDVTFVTRKRGWGVNHACIVFDVGEMYSSVTHSREEGFREFVSENLVVTKLRKFPAKVLVPHPGTLPLVEVTFHGLMPGGCSLLERGVGTPRFYKATIGAICCGV